MSILRFGTVAAATLLLAVPALAGKPIKRGAFTADPGLGYVLVRLGPGKGGTLTLQRYNWVDSTVALVESGEAASSRKQFDAAFVGGGNFLAETPEGRSFLVAARPGHWLILSAGETCFSLGSYGFEVRAGEITNLGTVLTGLENGKSPVPEIAAAALSPDLVNFGLAVNVVMSTAMLVRPATAGDAVPAGLGGVRVAPAALVADLRFVNACKTLVNRAIGLPPLRVLSASPQPPGTGR